jgi:hypothetical protein
LTLEEFGFATTEDWERGTEAYVLEMLRTGSDEALAQLDSYLHPTAGPTAMPQPDALTTRRVLGRATASGCF